jgi:hypothetical protein
MAPHLVRSYSVRHDEHLKEFRRQVGGLLHSGVLKWDTDAVDRERIRQKCASKPILDAILSVVFTCVASTHDGTPLIGAFTPTAVVLLLFRYHLDRTKMLNCDTIALDIGLHFGPCPAQSSERNVEAISVQDGWDCDCNI